MPTIHPEQRIDQPRHPRPQPWTRPDPPLLPTALLAMLALLSLPTPIFAEDIIVTRKIADIYAVKGDNLLLLTVDCDVHALTTPAKLQPESGRMVLRFPAATTATAPPTTSNNKPLAANTVCDLRDMVTAQQIPRGRYHVRLSYDSADWYAIAGTNLLLRTLGCERRTANEPVVWFQPMEGKGVIEYRSGNPCTSDGVFGSLRRQARSNAVAATGAAASPPTSAGKPATR